MYNSSSIFCLCLTSTGITLEMNVYTLHIDIKMYVIHDHTQSMLKSSNRALWLKILHIYVYIYIYKYTCLMETWIHCVPESGAIHVAQRHCFYRAKILYFRIYFNLKYIREIMRCYNPYLQRVLHTVWSHGWCFISCDFGAEGRKGNIQGKTLVHLWYPLLKPLGWPSVAASCPLLCPLCTHSKSYDRVLSVAQTINPLKLA